jgi:hypothetical protein
MARPHIEPFVDRDVDFKKMTLPGFGPGMNYKMLSLDTDSGACTMTVQFDGGYEQPPSVCRSDYELLIMEGGLQVGEMDCGPGYYFFVPKGVAMPAFSTRQGCLALMMYNDTEPNIEESDQDIEGADRSGLVQVNSYENMSWVTGLNIFPATAPGCLLKLLHYDQRTHAMSFLYCMVPGFWQDNISYHDCAEEAYHIWGTSWMMQFGDLPTGGYFWRPAFINHGAFASELGILAFGRTDGHLHNHFHWNPYSTPEENADRAAARLIREKPELHKWMWSRDHNHIDFEYPGEVASPESEDHRIHSHIHQHPFGEHEHSHTDGKGRKLKHKH